MSNYVVSYGPAGAGLRSKPPEFTVHRAALARASGGWSVGRERIEPTWIPRKLTWATSGGISQLELQRILGAGAEQSALAVEDVQVAQGDCFRLVEVHSAMSGGRRQEWFRGQVAREEVLIQGGGADSESYTITCLGPELRLAQKAVLGQWCKTTRTDDLEIAGALSAKTSVRSGCWASQLPCVFNAGGKPNASASAWKLDSDSGRYTASEANLACRAFEAPGRVVRDGTGEAMVQAEHWTAYTALRSLIEWVDRYEVISYSQTNWKAIESLLGEVVLGEVRVSGLDLLEAISAVLAPLGFGYALEPWARPEASGGYGHRLLVYSLSGAGPQHAPALAGGPGGNVSIDSAAGRRATVQRLHFVRDSRRVRNEIHVLGDQKRVQVDLDFGGISESSWDLQPYWDTAEHSLASWLTGNEFRPHGMPGGSYTFGAFHKKYDHGGEDFEQYSNVFRSFAWNEDGGLGGVTATVPDLTALGSADGNALRRPRPVGETYTWDDNTCRTRRLPAQVWIALVRSDTGVVDEASWLQVPAALWRDRAGLTLRAGKVSLWYPWAGEETRAVQAVPGEEDMLYQDVHYLTLLHQTLTNGAGPKLLLRLSGSVETDQTLSATASAVSDGLWPTAARRAVYAPLRFQWRQRSDTGVWGSALPADTRDDRAAAETYAQDLAGSSGAAVGQCHLLLRHLTREYAPGAGAGRTTDRRIDMALDASGQRSLVVTKVTWDFTRAGGKTELTLQSPPARRLP